MATSGFSYGKSAAEWNVFVIFVMAWCWFNATESKPPNVIGQCKKADPQMAHLVFAETRANAQKTKRAIFYQRTDRRQDIKK